MNFAESQREKYSKLSEQEKLDFWVSTIRMMMRMQSSVSHPYDVFTKKVYKEFTNLDQEFDKYFESVISSLNLDRLRLRDFIN